VTPPEAPSAGELRRGLPGGPRFQMAPRSVSLALEIADSKLRQAKFVGEPPATPITPLDGIRRLGLDARWKALAAALPERPAGRIIPVAGSLLKRPVRVAVPGELPAIFEIPLRPVSFPQMALQMASLADRLHRTDRIGFTPP